MEIYCRIITTEYAESVELQIKEFISDRLNQIGATDVSFGPFVPYWKIEGHGELSLHFSTQTALDEIQLLFADTWHSNAADAKWSNIYCPAFTFLWISQ